MCIGAKPLRFMNDIQKIKLNVEKTNKQTKNGVSGGSGRCWSR